MANQIVKKMASQLSFGDLLAESEPKTKSIPKTEPLQAGLSAIEAAANTRLASVSDFQANREKQAATERPWLCIELPKLSLEVLVSAQATPHVVSQSQKGRAVVVSANDSALGAGIEIGMTVASAHALHDSLIVLERSLEKEQHRLTELADWLYGFSSQVSLQPPNQLLVEIGGSLNLFGGAKALIEQLQYGLQQRGHYGQLAQAETPTAARWLCRYSNATTTTNSRHAASLNQRLGQLPISVLSETANVQQLRQLGVKTLADVLRLPRAGLARRFGPALLLALDQAKGLRPEPLQTHKPALHFEENIELDEELASLSQFWPLVQTLLAKLTSFAQAHNRGFQQIQLRLDHADSSHVANDEEARRDLPPHTVVHLRLLQPGNQLPRIEPLMHGQLEALALPAPIRALTLTVRHFMTWTPQTEDAIGTTVGNAASSNATVMSSASHTEWVNTLERLQLRLGQPRLLGLYLNNDHRPEKAWFQGPPVTTPPAAGTTGNILKDTLIKAVPNAPESEASQQRPNWLLPKPVALTRPQLADLRLISRPERIQSGWWSSEPMARDYFVVSNEDGQRLWVFRDDNGWFCHGLFS